MVQPRSRLWFRQAARRIGRRGCVRAHGNRAHLSSSRTAAGPAPGGTDRPQRQGTDGGRAARVRCLGVLAVALTALIACSPAAPAHNASSDSAATADPRAQTGLREVPLTIRTSNATRQFRVEVAATPEQQQRGLMFRKSLAGNRGMIFPYDPPQDVSFWMKNTLIPLDIIFIRGDGTIVRITHAKALDLTGLPAGEPVAAVLEIRGGRAAELGIKEGDTVSWPN